ncbi:hypothetical protein VTJ04DRAFT_10720 [Mycothermus thermophilus]|uniref:uncharacterized protein n=1 Tax=Humicola insolens TaxID=85995 RepID=UPI003744A181
MSSQPPPMSDEKSQPVETPSTSLPLDETPGLRNLTPKEYAEAVRTYANSTAAALFNHSESYGILADFLMRPYISQSPRVSFPPPGPKGMDATAQIPHAHPPPLKWRARNGGVNGGSRNPMAHFPPPKLPIGSKGSGASPQPFASLFKVSEKEVAKVPFTSVDDFCGLDNAKILPGSDNFVILLLQGYPSPEWLNALGSRRLDGHRLA